MIDLRREPQPPGPVITGFSGTGFRVGETVFPDGLLMTPEHAFPWEMRDIAALDPVDVEALLGIDPLPEFLLLGTGGTLVHPSRSFVRALEERGIGVEAMDSRAAARAWGVLRAEERWIVAALLPL